MMEWKYKRSHHQISQFIFNINKHVIIEFERCSRRRKRLAGELVNLVPIYLFIHSESDFLDLMNHLHLHKMEERFLLKVLCISAQTIHRLFCRDTPFETTASAWCNLHTMYFQISILNYTRIKTSSAKSLTFPRWCD